MFVSENLLTVGLVSLLLWVAASDFRSREIPDSASALLAALGVGLWLSEPLALLWNIIFAGLVSLTLGLAGGYAWKRSGREWLGLGDAKLIGAGTIVVGWTALWHVVFLASVGAIFATLSRRQKDGKEGVPFGPFVAYAIFVTHLIVGPSS